MVNLKKRNEKPTGLRTSIVYIASSTMRNYIWEILTQALGERKQITLLCKRNKALAINIF